jgi:hypothetical protein
MCFIEHPESPDFDCDWRKQVETPAHLNFDEFEVSTKHQVFKLIKIHAVSDFALVTLRTWIPSATVSVGS